MKKLQETSLEAYRSLDPRQMQDIYRQVLVALDELGEATFEELAANLKVSPARVWKRLSEMAKMELIYRPGNKRKLKSGRMGFTWMRSNPSRTEKEKQSTQDFLNEWQEEKPTPRFQQPELFQ